MGLRNQNSIEEDDRLSEFNFGSRQNYSINEALIEKRLIQNSSLIMEEKPVHIVIDLSTCCDRQLANVSSILLESVGANRQAIRLIAKILPVFKYYTCSRFGISQQSYRSPSKYYGRTGQGNLLSGESCKV